MKKIALVAIMFFALLSAGYAQEKLPANASREKAEELKSKLGLTHTQTVRVQGIYQESINKFERIKAKDHGDNSKMSIDLAPVRRETIEKIRSVLTRNQAIKFDHMIKESSSAGEGWSGGWSGN